MATYDRDEFIRVEFTTTCKYCKKTGFEWSKENGKYRLIDRAGKIHTCRPTMLAPDKGQAAVVKVESGSAPCH